MEQTIKDIYNDCAKLFCQYTKDHDMERYNAGMVFLKGKYPDNAFLTDILWAFAKPVNVIHRKCIHCLSVGGK